MDKKFLFPLVFALCAVQTFASVYYVAVDGKDSNVGSKEKPFGTLNKANSVVNAGDTVWIRGGVYELRDTIYSARARMSGGIILDKSGKSDDNRIHYLAYPGERPIFDGANLLIGTANKEYSVIDSPDKITYTSAIVIVASYLHLKGLEVRNVPLKYYSNAGVQITRSKHIFLEQMDSHHNMGAGFFVHDGSDNGGGHYFLNCDAHDNYDVNGIQGDGENADGFGVHYQYNGDTTKFYGCRSWWNSDDGWDLIAQDFPVVVENSYAMGNGYSHFGTYLSENGNGNGFKMGYSRKETGHHVIKNCVAWKNEVMGFYANYSGAGSTWINNTAYENGDRDFNMASTTYDADGKRTADVAALTGSNAHVLKNNISFKNSLSQIGNCWVKSETVDEHVDCAAGENNTWNLKLNLTEDDFLSLDDPSMTVTGEDLSKIAGILGPRNADGSVPNVDFLKLKKGSRAIDAGVDVGMIYAGEAPDLGAYEYGLSSAAVSSSSSSEKPEASSSSSAGSTSIVPNFERLQTGIGFATVFDIQGRFLGTLPMDLSHGESVEVALKAKFKQSGVYLVRWKSSMQRVNVK